MVAFGLTRAHTHYTMTSPVADLISRSPQMTVEHRAILNSLDEDAVLLLLMLTPDQVLDTSPTALTRRQLVAGILLHNATVQTGTGARGAPLVGDLRRQLLCLITANVGITMVALSRIHDTTIPSPALLYFC